MSTIQVTFFNDSNPELLETNFSHPLLGEELRCYRGQSIASGLMGGFFWTRAVQGLSVFLLRSAAHNHPYVYSGQNGSLAASLDDALSKMPNWLLDMFGMTPSGKPLVRQLIARNNPQRKRPGPVSLALRSPHVLKIEVSLDEERITSPNELNWIAHCIEMGEAARTLSDIDADAPKVACALCIRESEATEAQALVA